MYTEKDYLLRLIHEIIRTLFKLLLGKDIEERPALSSENEETYHKLIGMIDYGEINLAENCLMEEMDLNDIQHVQLSLLFYEHLNGKDDSFLSEHDFSRKEVWEGITFIAGRYGCGEFVAMLAKDME